jgi:hypothetical protein
MIYLILYLLVGALITAYYLCANKSLPNSGEQWFHALVFMMVVPLLIMIAPFIALAYYLIKWVNNVINRQ